MNKNGFIILIMLMSLVGTRAFANDFSLTNADGVTIYYKETSSTTVAVSCRGMWSDSYSDEYSGNVVIPESFIYRGKTYWVTSIHDGAFGYCSSLTSITIPKSVTSIGEYAFRGCNRLTSINIPNSIKEIGKRAFQNCTGLTEILVESGNTKYDSRNECNAIIETASNTLTVGCKNTIIPNSVTSIGKYAFEYCSSLVSITIPNNVTSIGDYAFQYCSSLTSVTIGNKVTNIGSEAFNSCLGLQKVIVPDIATWCGIYFKDRVSNPLYYAHHLYSDEDTEITELMIPEGVTNIERMAFYYCSGLVSLTIPNSVASIGEQAFYNTWIKSVIIGTGILSIGESAFDSFNINRKVTNTRPLKVILKSATNSHGD